MQERYRSCNTSLLAGPIVWLVSKSSQELFNLGTCEFDVGNEMVIELELNLNMLSLSF